MRTPRSWDRGFESPLLQRRVGRTIGSCGKQFPCEPERLVIGLDLGKRRDFSALIVARRIFLYEHEFASITTDPLQPMGGAVIEEPHLPGQPESEIPNPRPITQNGGMGSTKA